MNHADYVLNQIGAGQPWSAEMNFFFEALSAAEFHWFFVQGLAAIRTDLYVPGVSALLNGVEASVRVTLHQITAERLSEAELSPYRVLSNTLLKSAAENGMPVEALAFPGETDFLEKLSRSKDARTLVEIVRLRNDICHGNILKFIEKTDDREQSFFTPYSLRNVSALLLAVCFTWAKALGTFRRERGLMHYGPTPEVPSPPISFG
jgi:hypothetical protein